MFYSCCFIIRAPLKKVSRSPLLWPPLAGADWGASFIYHPDKSVFPGKSFRKLQTASLLISPPLYLGTSIHLPPPCRETETLEGGGSGSRKRSKEEKKGWEVKETQRDKSKREKAWPLQHNNMGDLTSLLQFLWASDNRGRQAQWLEHP